MQKLSDMFAQLRRSQDGATAVEYGIMVALIAAVIIASVVLVGNSTKDAFDTVCDEVNKSASPVECK